MSDVGDLLELLHGARNRWTTLHASVRNWHHLARGQIATERWLATKRGSVMQAYAGDPRAELPETVERSEELWIAKPDRARVETDGHVQVTRGRTWWSWSPHHGFMTNENDPETGTNDPLQSFAAHLDPAVLLPQLEVERIAGDVIAVRPRSGEFYQPGLPPGADHHVLMIDHRGIVVRLESFVADEPFLVSELIQPVWDELIPDDIFVLDPPEGEDVYSPRDRHGLDLTLDEAAARASFAVWAIAELPEGVWRTRAHHHRAVREIAEQLTILYNRVDGRALIHLLERAAGVEAPWSRIHGAAEVSVERDGTHVSLQSEDFDEETLRSLAENLVRV